MCLRPRVLVCSRPVLLMTPPPLIVGIGGTTRPGSTAERALEVTLARATTLGCRTQLIGADGLPQEAYDPTRPQRSDRALALVAALRSADGIVLATPSYHGGLSGLMKNAIDFVEDLRDDPRIYLERRAVGCIVCADGPQALGSTLMSLRSIVHALRGWPTPYGAAINARSRPLGGPAGQDDPAVVEACQRVADEVVAFARMVQAVGPR